MKADQAEGLRQLSQPKSVKVVAVTSGKGGVGKTNVSVNLAVSLAQQGSSVILFDADLGLANVDIALGIKPTYDIRHVIEGERTLEEIIVKGPEGINIIPASSGVSKMANLSAAEHGGLIRAFSDLTLPVDYLIVDTGAGIDHTVVSFTKACQEILVIVCDEPTSITDAYALIKVLSRDHNINNFQILANMVYSENQGRELYGKLAGVTDRFLDVNLGYLGSIPNDDYLRESVKKQAAVVSVFPRCKASVAIRKIADQLNSLPQNEHNGGLGFFVERLLQAQAAGLEAGA